MYYELYIDIFFLENFMMDSLLLLAINRILKCGRSYGRLFLSGALGSLLTCLVIVLPVPGFMKLILFHFVVNSVMLIAGLGPASIAQFVKAFLILYGGAVFLGGIMQFFRPCMRWASLFYGAAVLGYFLLLKLWKIITYICRQQQNILTVTLYTKNGKKTANALWDTGNELRDFVTGDPVNILDPGFLAEITSAPEKEKGFHMIPYRYIGGNRIMKVFRIDKMCIHFKEDCWVENPLFGIGEESLSGEKSYDIILNPGVLSQ